MNSTTNAGRSGELPPLPPKRLLASISGDGWDGEDPIYGYPDGDMYAYARAAIAAHRAEADAEIARLRADAAYLRWRLEEILPLFEQARDALPAITLASAKLHGVSLDLGARMDRAGTRTRADFDAIAKEEGA